MLDGRIARLTNTTSAFGLRVRLARRRHLVRPRAGGAGVRVGAVGARSRRLGGRIHLRRRAAAMRLARFNIQSPTQVDKRYFVGMPTPAGGGRRRRDGLSRGRMPLDAAIRRPIAAVAVVLVPAALMVSTIRFRSFKTINFGWGPSYMPLLVFALFIAFIATEPRFTLLVLAYGYLLVGVHRAGVVTRVRARRDEPPRGSLTVTVVPRPGALAIVIVPPHNSTLRFALARPRPEPAVFVEKYGSNARAHGLGVHADAGVRRRDHHDVAVVRRAPRSRSVPPLRHRLQRVFDEVRQRAREERAIDPHRRQRARARRPRSRCASAEPGRYGPTTSSTSIGDGRRSRAAASARRRSSRTRRRSAAAAGPAAGSSSGTDRTTAPSGRPLVLVHALQVLGGQLNRRQRILDLVRDLPRHLAPRP